MGEVERIICPACKREIPVLKNPNGDWFKCPECGHVYEINYRKAKP